MSRSLPEFIRPPVSEVAISLQFKSLDSLRSSHLGLFWQALRPFGFSRVEEHPQLPAQYEEFNDTPRLDLGLRIQTFTDAAPPPRAWFLNEGENELVQLQRDRLILNWREGAGSQSYPRYSHIVKRFRFALELFEEFVKAERLGDVVPEQCEITYVNIIPLEHEWSRHGDLGRVIALWNGQNSDDYLPQPEDANLFVRFRMNDVSANPLGRLHVTLQSAYRPTDKKPVFMLTLTARGKPEPANSAGMDRLFEYEHEWIVRGFTSITTPRMHDFWGRLNGR